VDEPFFAILAVVQLVHLRFVQLFIQCAEQTHIAFSNVYTILIGTELVNHTSFISNINIRMFCFITSIHLVGFTTNMSGNLRKKTV
jgi:hypothetical protein